MVLSVPPRGFLGGVRPGDPAEIDGDLSADAEDVGGGFVRLGVDVAGYGRTGTVTDGDGVADVAADEGGTEGGVTEVMVFCVGE